MKHATSRLALFVLLSSGLGSSLWAQQSDSNDSQRGIGISHNSATVEEGGNQVEIADGGAVQIDTQNPDFDRGMEFLFADQMPQAIELLGRSLKSDPTNPQAHINLGEAYYHLHKYEQVIDECNTAIKLSKAGWVYRTRHSVKSGTADPLVKTDLASAFAKRGIAKWELKQKPAAVADFDEALRMGETNSTLYIYRGQFYLNEGSLDKARQDFDAAIKVDPKMALPYGLRALVELKQGDDALAAADFDRADQIDPSVHKLLESAAEGILAARK